MPIPEISRLCHCDEGDILQIFGENFTPDTKLYVWLNDENAFDETAFITKITQICDFGTIDEMHKLKQEIANNIDIPYVEENFNGKLESLLPETPPEKDVLIYDADQCEGHVLYFGQGNLSIRAKTSVIWLKNEAGFSKPKIFCRPKIWNISESESFKGEHISTYGVDYCRPINLGAGCNRFRDVMLKNKETGELYRTKGVGITAYSHNVQRYLNDFVIPKDIPAGEYEIFQYSGHCGIFGWSEGYPITIKDRISVTDYYRHKWNRIASNNYTHPQCKITRIAAKNDPFYDSAKEIQQAIDELSASGGGILKLSSGIFYVSETIYVKPGVVVSGEGNSTVIRAFEGKDFYQDWSKIKFAVRPDGMAGWGNDWYEHYLRHKLATLMILQEDCGTDSIRLEMGDGVNIGIMVANTDSRNCKNVFINKTEVDACCLDEYELAGLYGALCCALMVGGRTDNFTVWSSSFTATHAVQILPARHENAVFVNSTVNCHPRQIGEAQLSGLRHSVIANNTFIGGRRAYLSQGGQSYNWIYQNRVIDCSRAGGAEEAYMSEHGLSEWNGYALDYGEDYIIIAEKSIPDIFVYGKSDDMAVLNDCYNRFMFILSGRGFGQQFKITGCEKVDEGKYKLIFDRPFDVAPDNTSYFNITWGTHHNLFVDNSTVLSNGHSQFVYDSGWDNLVVGHEMTIAGGVYMMCYNRPNGLGRGSFRNTFGVDAFNTFSDCQTKSCGVGLKFVSSGSKPAAGDRYSGMIGGYEEYNYTGGTFGNCVRNCSFQTNPSELYIKNLWKWNGEVWPVGIHIDGAYNRVVDCKIRGYETAFALPSRYKGNCFFNNIVVGQKKMFMGQGVPIGKDVKGKFLIQKIKNAKAERKAKKIRDRLASDVSEINGMSYLR